MIVDDIGDSHHAVSDVENLDLLLDELEILIMSQLWRISMKYLWIIRRWW